jgi:D-glycero-D-manno-heptose 1,7-bisphosphate phosphatase
MNKALFLDRDGVINEEINYLHRIEDVVFIDEIFSVCRFYLAQGFLIFIITNQAGIAKGIFSESEYQILTEWILNEFSKREIHITQVYHCPHHPDYTGPCNCRKPEPGMLLKAKESYDIDFSQSILIGDKLSDLEAGFKSGIQHSYHIEEILDRLDHLPLVE